MSNDTSKSAAPAGDDATVDEVARMMLVEIKRACALHDGERASQFAHAYTQFIYATREHRPAGIDSGVAMFGTVTKETP